jgi:uncharacterized protein YbjT (DUF2867 family)
LRELGAEVVVGDFEDRRTLEQAMAGVDAVFAGGTAHKAGPRGEQVHGFKLAEALRAANEPHLVYVSGAGADRSTGVPVLESKRAVEARLHEVAARNVTILAPVYFMENLFNSWNRTALHVGKLPLALPPTVALQQVATVDVASFAVLALERHDELAGERIELAGDELTGPDAAQALSKASGHVFEFEQTDLSELPSRGLSGLFEWLTSAPFAVSIAALRGSYPDVGWHTFEDWAASNDWTQLWRDCLVG